MDPLGVFLFIVGLVCLGIAAFKTYEALQRGRDA